MTKLWTTAAALLAGLMLTGGAQAQTDPLADVRTFCVDTNADAARALAAADAAGWQPVPTAMLGEPRPGMSNMQGRLRTSAAGFQVLITADGTQPVAGETMDMSICIVGGQGGDAAGLGRAIAEYTGSPGERRPGQTSTLYSFADTPAGRRALGSDDPDAEALLRAGRMRMMFLEESAGMVMAGYGVPQISGRSSSTPAPVTTGKRR